MYSSNRRSKVPGKQVGRQQAYLAPLQGSRSGALPGLFVLCQAIGQRVPHNRLAGLSASEAMFFCAALPAMHDVMLL